MTKGLRSVWIVAITLLSAFGVAVADQLPSWNDGPAKQSIVAFVTAATDQGSQNYIQPPDRISVFDNDGTLWTEQPIYFQFMFALDRLKQLAPQHPEWTNEQPFKAALSGNIRAVAASGDKGLVAIMMATQRDVDG